jgi:hypothetical protein
MSAGDVIRLMDVAMRHRRVLFGDPTDTIAVTGPGSSPLAAEFNEFADLPAEERRARLADLAAAVARRVAAADGDDDDDEVPPGETSTADVNQGADAGEGSGAR